MTDAWAVNPQDVVFEEEELPGDLEFMRRTGAVKDGWVLMEWEEDGTLTIQGTPEMLLKNSEAIEAEAVEIFPRRTVFIDEDGKVISTTTDIRSIDQILSSHVVRPSEGKR